MSSIFASPTSIEQTSVPETRSKLISDVGVDGALLVCALFLQRFTLSFGHSLLELVAFPVAFILVHQFISGRLLIDYDRFIWFLLLGICITCTLMLNFHSAMLPSYCLFMVLYLQLTLRRSVSADGYQGTLRTFQRLALLFAVLAALQFVAQFAIDGRSLIRFFGILPDFVLSNRWNTIIPLTAGSSLIKSNGIFLVEPSALSQLMGLAILIEILEFGRLRYLLILTLGLLLAYSGTGLLLVLSFLPLAAFRDRRARGPALLFVGFALALFATKTVDPAAFTVRIGEFENIRTSGFARFISPFWLAKEHIETASPLAVLLGSGPGTANAFAESVWYTGFEETWFKLFYEYGLIGSTIFVLFLASCLRKAMSPGLVLAAVLFIFVFLGGELLSAPFLTMMIVLCSLNMAGARRPPIGSRGLSPRLAAVGRAPG
jgi:hypothetical protein